jgi:hypothetical protein
MSDLVAFLLVAALALQVPVAILAYVDAKRLGFENPEWYWFGIIVPAAGFAVALYYFTERKNLPKADCA